MKYNENKKYYYDNYTDEVVNKKDSYAAPERYVTMYVTSGDFFTCSYDVKIKKEYKIIDFSYSKDDAENFNELFHAFLNEKKIKEKDIIRLCKIGYPKDEFIEFLKEC